MSGGFQVFLKFFFWKILEVFVTLFVSFFNFIGFMFFFFFFRKIEKFDVRKKDFWGYLMSLRFFVVPDVSCLIEIYVKSCLMSFWGQVEIFLDFIGFFDVFLTQLSWFFFLKIFSFNLLFLKVFFFSKFFVWWFSREGFSWEGFLGGEMWLFSLCEKWWSKGIPRNVIFENERQRKEKMDKFVIRSCTKIHSWRFGD